MGLLDSVLGSGMAPQRGHEPAVAARPAEAVCLGGLGGLIAMAAQNPQWVQAAMGMFARDGVHGGLAGLVEKLQRAGLGDVMASRLGNRANQPVS